MTNQRSELSVSVWFMPDHRIEVPLKRQLHIKGMAPGKTAGVHFAEVYASAPELSVEESFAEVDRTFASILTNRDTMNRFLTLSSVSSPSTHAQIGPYSTSSYGGWTDELTRPYRISECRADKIAHSFSWIHTNLSKDADRLSTRIAPEMLFYAFSVILKADNYRLARLITPNGSMTLQQALIGAVLLNYREVADRAGRFANGRALRTLSQLGDTADLLKLCELSTFAGTTWFGERKLYVSTDWGESGLIHQMGQGGSWGVDQRSRFLGEALQARSLVLIMDDCGEAVFDLRLLTALLQQNRTLQATVLARAVADGTNVTATDVRNLAQILAFRCKCDLSDRIRVIAVSQPFPAFEPAFFTRSVVNMLENAEVVLVKGAAFFETTLLHRPAYHSFVVHGESSQRLTGLPRGTGVFRWIPEPESAYGTTIGAVVARQLREDHAE